jgi:hypothetical protein
LELILNLPVWILALLAVIQFGQLLSNLQQLSLASRVGAEEASETAPATIIGAVTVPSNMNDVIERQLQSAGLVDSGGVARFCVILQHDLDGIDDTLTYSAPGTDCADCEPPSSPDLPITTPATRYVRVTVCVPFYVVAPNLLSQCGLDFGDNVVRQTTTFMHESPP